MKLTVKSHAHRWVMTKELDTEESRDVCTISSLGVEGAIQKIPWFSLCGLTAADTIKYNVTLGQDSESITRAFTDCLPTAEQIRVTQKAKTTSDTRSQCTSAENADGRYCGHQCRNKVSSVPSFATIRCTIRFPSMCKHVASTSTVDEATYSTTQGTSTGWCELPTPIVWSGIRVDSQGYRPLV